MDGASGVQWTSCPECGSVAEVVDRDVWPSTDGPVEHVHVRCAARHRFVMPAASLEQHHELAAVRAAERSAAGGRDQRGALPQAHVAKRR